MQYVAIVIMHFAAFSPISSRNNLPALAACLLPHGRDVKDSNDFPYISSPWSFEKNTFGFRYD